MRTLVLILAAGCATSPPAESSPAPLELAPPMEVRPDPVVPPPEPPPAALPPEAVAPPAAPPPPRPRAAAPAPAEPPCAVRVSTRARPVPEGRTELTVLMENLGTDTLSLAVRAACPVGPARWEGLPPGFDVGDACVQGPCPPGTPPLRDVILRQGETVAVDRVVLDPARTSCHPALSPGTYRLRARLDDLRAEACAGSPVTVRVAEPKPLPMPPPPMPPPPPEREPCPAMGCAYEPCPPGVEPPTGCAAVCGCPGARRQLFGPD